MFEDMCVSVCVFVFFYILITIYRTASQTLLSQKMCTDIIHPPQRFELFQRKALYKYVLLLLF